MAGLMTRLLLVVVLSCLISTAASDEACEIGTKSVSATCGVASAVLGFLGALLCVGSAGAACAPAFAGVAAVAGICSTGVSMVPCGGDGKLLRTNPCHSFVQSNHNLPCLHLMSPSIHRDISSSLRGTENGG